MTMREKDRYGRHPLTNIIQFNVLKNSFYDLLMQILCFHTGGSDQSATIRIRADEKKEHNEKKPVSV